MVIRDVVQANEFQKQLDGTSLLIPIPEKMNVQYGYGGTEPLNIKEVFELNLNQYRRARLCYSIYRRFLTARYEVSGQKNQ